MCPALRRGHSRAMLETATFISMAFKGRGGQTVAIGHGAMSTTMILWWLFCVVLVGPIAIVLEWAVWLVFAEQRADTAFVISQTYGVTFAALALVWTFQPIVLLTAAFAFAGPRNTFRDRLKILAASRTARWCALSWVLTISLSIVIRFPFGFPRSLIILALSVALIGAMLSCGLGLTRLHRTNRKAAYYTGMTDEEKRVSDLPRNEADHPSFPSAHEVITADDASRYARRAKTISETHVWVGAGIIVIFSAFIGTSISAMWESSDPITWIPMYFVFFALALGFWVERRARAYDQLRELFESRARELEKESRDSPEPRSFRALLISAKNHLLGRDGK